jgi:acetylornithine deacetylase/succinyl-diaminopimelate desuccinylase-like protein
VQPFSKTDLKIISSEPFDENSFKTEYGIKDFVGGKKGLDAKKALVGAPTCNIAGFVSGYTEGGAKTVLPATAVAKIDFRLVPRMDPKKQIVRLRNHLMQKGFGDIRVKVYHGEAAARTSPNEPLVSFVKKAADKAFGKSIINVSNAGTGPMHSFVKVLGAPCVSVGGTYMFARIHSPNEFARLDLLKKTTKCMCLVIDNFAG